MVKAKNHIDFIPNHDGVNIKKENEDMPFNTKRAKIIVRNLPFKNLSEEKLKEWFIEFGEIEDVNILKKDDGRFVGCGFVQFTSLESAANAVKKANLRKISGREIVVDWALPKNMYEKQVKKIKQEIKQEIDNDNDVAFDGEVLPYSIDVTPSGPDESVAEQQQNRTNYVKKEKFDDSENDSNNGGNGPDNCFLGSKENINESKNIKSNNKIRPLLRYNDVEDGTTLFIRNIPFSATNDDLRACFEKFGTVVYAVICIDKLTEHSKGSGFVKFKEKESADKCLQQKNKIFLDDNPLLVSVALSKENLKDKIDKKVTKDSRNLYLSREGVIMAGSKAAQGVSPSDMAKRLEIEHWKSQILKNLHMFISDKRLVIHNLPSDYDDKKLRALFLKYSRPNAVITEAKVMREKKKFDRNGLGISKELGFVAFTEHEDALYALRNINNNPKIFSVKKRPIVSFSVESKAVLNMKKKRLEKSRKMLGIDMDNNSDKLMKLNRKQRRFIRRRDKIIKKRREGKKLKVEPANDTDEVKRKRKIVDMENKSSNVKRRKLSSIKEDQVNTSNEYCGVVSEPGKIVKLRSRFKLKNQVRIHSQKLKEEKLKKKSNKAKKLEVVKQPKQRKKQNIIDNDRHTSKLITKHKKALEKVPRHKKWDER